MAKENDGRTVAFVDARWIGGNGPVSNKVTEETVAVSKFDGPVARVTRGYGFTRNMGNFESARVEVRVEVPCYVEDIDAADAWAEAWVEARLSREMAELDEIRKGGS